VLLTTDVPSPINNEIARYGNTNYIQVNEFREERNICMGCADAAAIMKGARKVLKTRDEQVDREGRGNERHGSER